MRHRRGLAIVVLGFFAVAGVGGFSQTAFEYALIQASCAPWDGPAINITLTQEPPQCKRTMEPCISMGVWRGLPIHPGQEVKFGSGSDAGFASRCKKVGYCERAESGTIIFESYQEGSGASGHYELHFKGGETLSGTFDAKWCDTRVVCG